jgi:hypothetical protein
MLVTLATATAIDVIIVVRIAWVLGDFPAGNAGQHLHSLSVMIVFAH